MHSSKLSYVFILSALAIVLFASSGLAEHVIALTPEHVLTHANNHHHIDKQTPLAPPPSIIDPSVDGETRTLEQKIWETSTFSLEELMSGAVQLLASVIDYVAKHPEVAALILLTLLVPALQAWLTIIGFGLEGVVSGSIAARLQSRMGNVPKGSIFAFLQSNGAVGFARSAMLRGGVLLAVAVAIAIVGKALYDRGVGHELVEKALVKVWDERDARSVIKKPVTAGAAGLFAHDGWLPGGVEKVVIGSLVAAWIGAEVF